MGSDTNHGGSCQPILHVGPTSKGRDLEPYAEHWERHGGSAKYRGDNNPWVPCSSGGILSTTMAPEGLGRIDYQREGFSILRCLLPTTILQIRPSAPSNGLAPTGRKAIDVDCRYGRGHFLNHNIDRTTATEAVGKKVDRFYGSRYHDRSISNPLHSSETKTLTENYH